MSLIPLLFDQVYSRPVSLFDQNFGLGLYDDELPLSIHSGYIRPWRHLSRANSGISNVASKSGAFQVNLDVQQFKPDEIAVKTEENFVVIECKHEEKQDQHGFISRQFVRKYLLPDNVDKGKVECKLSSDGVLTVSAPKLVQEGTKSQTIPIQQTNQPALRGEQSQQKSAEQEKTQKDN
ncbi:alpha-crystallin A chain-like [Cloeon dipterum]|uniref:alpha-crystallin A chain-like n=1 Tax=Cloeon dipterum TaxID=197152 RepID=UPI0032202A16